MLRGPGLFHTSTKLDRKKRTNKGTRNLGKSNRLTESGLTVEQEAYCRCRATGMSIDEAIIASGSTISKRTAIGWEQPNGDKSNRNIIKRINELSEIANKNAILRTGLNREWVISRYMKVVDRCMQAEPVVKIVKGELVETGEYQFNASGANSALKALGEIVGLFNKKEENPDDEFEHLSDEELARLARELAAQTGILESDSSTQESPGQKQIIEIQALPEAN